MQLTRLNITNYKCFRESGDVQFTEGFNVIVGANSSGKTALLDALTVEGIKNEPHRSLHYGGAVEVRPTPAVELDLTISGRELRSALLRSGRIIRVPIPTEQTGAAFK